MSDERRDDKNLRSLFCPHCEQMVPVLQVDAVEKQQLLFMKCPNCDGNITKDQIDAAYREYDSPTLDSPAEAERRLIDRLTSRDFEELALRIGHRLLIHGIIDEETARRSHGCLTHQLPSILDEWEATLNQ